MSYRRLFFVLGAIIWYVCVCFLVSYLMPVYNPRLGDYLLIHYVSIAFWAGVPCIIFAFYMLCKWVKE